MKLVLIDGDSLIWRVAYKFSEQDVNPEDMWMVENRVTLELKEILQKTEADQYIGLVQHGEPCFRYNLAWTAPYKGTRADKPEWFTKLSPHIIKLLESKYSFSLVSGKESDDVISILANTPSYESFELIIAGIDKDLLQIPGKHYNYAKDSWLLVHEDVAAKNLWMQILQGDSSDSIQGLPGVGPAKAEKILADVEIEKYPYVCLQAYIQKFGERLGILKFAETCNLVTLLTEGDIGLLEVSLNPFKGDKGAEEKSAEDFFN